MSFFRKKWKATCVCVCVCVCVRACNKLSFSFNTSELVTTEIFSKEAKQLLNENVGDLGA